MRKLLLSAFAGLTLLAGCATNPTTGVTTVSPSFIASVQSIASTTCAFIPTVDTIIAMFNAGIGATATAVSSAICSGVSKPAASARLKGLPFRSSGAVAAPLTNVIINGVSVPITGWRAR